MKKTLLLLGVGLGGIAVGVLGATYVAAEGAAQVTRTELLRKPVSGVEGKEFVVFVADLPPGAVAGGRIYFLCPAFFVRSAMFAPRRTKHSA
jgi:hypothetical protein